MAVFADTEHPDPKTEKSPPHTILWQKLVFALLHHTRVQIMSRIIMAYGFRQREMQKYVRAFTELDSSNSVCDQLVGTSNNTVQSHYHMETSRFKRFLTYCSSVLFIY